VERIAEFLPYCQRKKKLEEDKDDVSPYRQVLNCVWTKEKEKCQTECNDELLFTINLSHTNECTGTPSVFFIFYVFLKEYFISLIT